MEVTNSVLKEVVSSCDADQLALLQLLAQRHIERIQVKKDSVVKGLLDEIDQEK